MDTGYDYPTIGFPNWERSSWNNWYHQNVMEPEPHFVNHPEKGWVSEHGYKKRVISDYGHPSMEFFQFNTKAPKVKELTGQFYVHYNDISYAVNYLRNVLFIANDNSTKPYVIDLNTLYTRYDPYNTGDLTIFNQLGMRYYGNANNYLINSGDWFNWDVSANSTSTENMYTFLKPIEFSGSLNYEQDSLLTHEYFRDYRPPKYVKTLKLNNKDWGSTELDDFSTVSLINISASSPENTPLRIFNHSSTIHPYQGWTLKQSSTTLDLIIKRSSGDPNYNSDLELPEYINNEFVPSIVLPGGKDYGFARFEKNNGVWEIDPDYQVNLISNYFAYTGSSSVGTKTYPSDAVLYITSSSTLTVTGDVTLQSGTTVYMDPDAAIQVNSSGSIDADGVTFTTTDGSTDPADHWKHIKLNSGANNFDNCWFIGAEKALYVSNSSGASNLVENSNLHYNEVGVYINDGNITLAGTQVQLSTNSYGVVVRGTGDLATTSTGSGVSFEPTLIKLNTTGLYAYDYSTVYVKHTKFAQNDYNLKGAGQGQINAGQTSYQHLPFGYNAFDMAGSYDIYNTSTHTVDALYNWWGWAAEPNASRFYGSVDYESALSCDPTTDGTYCDPIDDGGGGCYPYCYSASTAPPPMMSGQPGATSSNSALATPVDQETVKQYISSLYQTIRERSDDPHIYRAARQIYLLLDMYDTDGSLREWAGFDEKLQDWQSLVLNAQHLENPEGGNALAADRLGWAAVFMQIRDELKDQNYGRVHKLAQKWSPLLSNSNDRVSLLAAQAVAWERSKEFGKALAAYESIEQIEQRSAIAGSEGYAPADYSIVKAELTDSMNARQQSKAMLAHSSTKKDKQFEEPPKTLEVDDPYPNPFNPTTTVPFAVPEQAHVSIEVYNALGRKVATLTDQSYQVGRYEVQFNADNLSSGIYFIRTHMGSQQFLKKITLIK